MKKTLLLTISCFLSLSIWAQGDSKSTASVLDETNDYSISSPSAFSGTTLSSGAITCEEGTFSWSKDIWFTFEAETSSYTFKGNRNISNSFAYQVSDADDNVLTCEKGFIGFGSSSPNSRVDFTLNNLTVGETYYIRVAVDFLGTDNFAVNITPEGLISSTDSFDPETDIRLFPNPVKDQLNVQSASNQEYTLTIFSTVGNVLYKQKDFTIENRINVEALQPGTYYIQLIDSHKNLYTKSFMVAK